MFGTSKKELWCCKATLAPGKSRDDVYTVCKAAKVDARDVIGAFAGLLTESRFQLLIKDPASENYFTARDLAEEIAKKKKIKDYEFHETVLGSKKDIEKGCAAAGQAIFAYCPGLDAVLTLVVKRDTPEGEQRRQDMFAVGDIITQKVREGQQQQTNKIEKTVVEAATDIRDGVGKVLVTQSKVLVAEGRDNKKEIKETVNQRADEQMAFNAKMLEELEQARLDREEAKREMKRMNRLLAGRQLPEIEAAPQSASEQLALESPRGHSYERLVEPPSAGSDTLGVTPRTESMGVRRALAPKFSLLRDDRPSPASPESLQEDVEDVAAASDDDDAIVEEAPPKEDVAADALDDETVEAAPLQGAVAAAALDDQTVAAPAAVATPARAVGFDEELMRTSKSAWAWSRKKDPLTANYKDQPKYESPPVRDSEMEGKKKDPNWTPFKIPKPSPDDSKAPEKGQKVL
ncbi:unnamed protein product [Pelagomonas calceolata]|uniref:Uncharacterized protein n=1 Tax=Pelagomonas calceolata TaxID=35677 RepID=A0A8J2SMD0_9STRA|nr:unnamed protein product [Pelagomonas calceolata]